MVGLIWSCMGFFDTANHYHCVRKSCCLCCLYMFAQVYVTQKYKFMSFKGETNAEFSGVHSKVLRGHQNAVSPWECLTVHATHTLLVKVYPGTFALYAQTGIPALNIPTHKCVYHHIWVKGTYMPTVTAQPYMFLKTMKISSVFQKYG